MLGLAVDRPWDRAAAVQDGRKEVHLQRAADGAEGDAPEDEERVVVVQIGKDAGEAQVQKGRGLGKVGHEAKHPDHHVLIHVHVHVYGRSCECTKATLRGDEQA